ncbi:MAG: hypothetical protein ACXVC6_15190 [Bacteroidia bacterium]
MQVRESKYSLRHFENLHIPLWLLKDTCWMMEWKTLGITMIFPTISVAMYLAYKSRGSRDFWINMAVLFWITANAYWMSCEFFGHAELKFYAGIPFTIGAIFTLLFYILPKKEKTT